MPLTFMDPLFISTILLVWSVLLVCMIYFGVTNKQSETTFLRLGPGDKNAKENTKEKSSRFLGIEIDSWTKVIIIMIYAFTSQIIRTYSYTIIKPWITNTIHDGKTHSLDVSFAQVFFINNAYTIFNWLNRIVGIFLYFTLELQFILPEIIANLIVNNITTYYYLKTKTFVTKAD